MANYNQYQDDDRDYRGSNQYSSSQNRDRNQSGDNRRQQRWQEDDDNTRGVSGNDGYRSGSSSDRYQGRSGMGSSGLNRSGMSGNDQGWRHSQEDESRRYSGMSGMNRGSSYNSSDYGSSGYGSRNMGSYGQHDSDRSRGMGSSDRANSGNYEPRNQGYGSSYGQRPYTSGSDPMSYNRGEQRDWSSSEQRGGRSNRYEQGSDYRRSDSGMGSGMSGMSNRSGMDSYGRGGMSSGRSDMDHNRSGMDSYGRGRSGDYSQNYYDADENSRYRNSRGSYDEDRHDHDEHRGFLGRMADRVSDWFSDDDDRDNRRDDRRY